MRKEQRASCLPEEDSQVLDMIKHCWRGQRRGAHPGRVWCSRPGRRGPALSGLVSFPNHLWVALLLEGLCCLHPHLSACCCNFTVFLTRSLTFTDGDSWEELLWSCCPDPTFKTESSSCWKCEKIFENIQKKTILPPSYKLDMNTKNILISIFFQLMYYVWMSIFII